MLPPPDNGTCLARSFLCGTELGFYDDLVATLQRGQTSVSQKRISDGKALSIAMLVMRDHPEFYWVASVAKAGGFGNKLTMVNCLRPDRDFECLVADVQRRVFSNIPRSCSEYTIAKTAFGAVAAMASYDNDDRMNSKRFIQSHGMWGVFGVGIAVCDGFSAALQYLLQHAGIQAYRITGSAQTRDKRGLHSWVLARINGEYYHIDPTWGTMLFGELTIDKNPANADYDYLCLSDKDISFTHFPDEPFSIPRCTSTRSNYYRQEGYLLQRWDIRSLTDIIARQLVAGRTWISVRAATRTTFYQLTSLCADGDKFSDLMVSAYKVAGKSCCDAIQYAYVVNEQLYIVHFQLCC